MPPVTRLLFPCLFSLFVPYTNTSSKLDFYVIGLIKTAISLETTTSLLWNKEITLEPKERTIRFELPRMNNRFLNKLPPLKGREGRKEGSTVHNKSPMMYRSKPVTGSCRALSKSKRGIRSRLSLYYLTVFLRHGGRSTTCSPADGGMFYRIINIEWQRLSVAAVKIRSRYS